jgi:hypothetical protein
MATRFNGTSNGQPYDLTSDYHVIYASTTTYKVNISLTANGYTVKYTAWVQKDGTPTAVYYSGQNYTGLYAQTYFEAAMATYSIETTFTEPQVLPALTSPLFSHQSGQATITLGPTSVLVTDYTANSLPLNINECGFSGQFTRFSVQTGVVSGNPQTLLTGLNLTGSFNSGGTSQNADLTFHITSLTKTA